MAAPAPGSCRGDPCPRSPSPAPPARARGGPPPPARARARARGETRQGHRRRSGGDRQGARGTKRALERAAPEAAEAAEPPPPGHRRRRSRPPRSDVHAPRAGLEAADGPCPRRVARAALSRRTREPRQVAAEIEQRAAAGLRYSKRARAQARLAPRPHRPLLGLGLAGRGGETAPPRRAEAAFVI